MGDRSGNIRWWDVKTGQSSSFNTHREGIRRIKSSPVVAEDSSRGRIAVLFYDNTFAVYDLDSPDPRFYNLNFLEPLYWSSIGCHCNRGRMIHWYCALLELIVAFALLRSDKRIGIGSQPRSTKEKFRPMPLCSPILLPTPHALALRMILQLGVKPSWFNTHNISMDKEHYQTPVTTSSTGDLQGYMIHSPPIGDSVVPELLLKILEPYRKEEELWESARERIPWHEKLKGEVAVQNHVHDQLVDPAGCCKGGPNMSSMLSITSGAGALQEALTALREAQQLDTAAMFILAYHEIRAEFISSLDSDGESSPSNKENCLSCQG
ncbi:unnamed protein product [Ilex paraguariensis]|uniref:Uncharacterized protein n=1 Tax=Ilex paraguariensis TaxID=185542 RepID=A0ABC8RK63_9AQUA